MRLHLPQPRLTAFDTGHSFTEIRRLLQPRRDDMQPEDVLLLPEHISFVGSTDAYRESIAVLASELGCTVVGGSFHNMDEARRVNAGVAVSADGDILGEYEKLRPYADERQRVDAGTRLGEFTLQGIHVLVLICADFWFTDLLLQASTLPNLVLVPALSVTRKSSPAYSRSLWRHLAITRAYEFGMYVGISDWAHSSALPKLRTSGVGGFADPTTHDPERLFRPAPEEGLLTVDIDMAALEAFREDRRERGFFWKKERGG